MWHSLESFPTVPMVDWQQSFPQVLVEYNAWTPQGPDQFILSVSWLNDPSWLPLWADITMLLIMNNSLYTLCISSVGEMKVNHDIKMVSHE